MAFTTHPILRAESCEVARAGGSPMVTGEAGAGFARFESLLVPGGARHQRSSKLPPLECGIKIVPRPREGIDGVRGS